MDGPLVFVGVLVVLAIAVGIYSSWLQEKKRREALAQLARDLGFGFAPGNDRDHDDEYRQFGIFRRGHSRAAFNTMSGALELFGRPCRTLCGDFRYKVTQSNGKTTTTSTYRFSYLIVHPPWRTPALLIRPEGVFDKLKGAFGFDDIDFESDAFSRRFYVESDDRKFAYDVVHPRMMEFLLAEDPPMIDIEGGALCLGGGSRRWSPQRFRDEIAFVERLCALWPRHLVQDLDARGARTPGVRS